MPRIAAAKMRGNYATDGAWCPGCGLHLKVYGEHRADCTTKPPPCEECRYYPAVNEGRHRPDCSIGRLSTTAIPNGDKPLHHGPDTRASPNP